MESRLNQPEVEAVDWVIQSNSPGFEDWTALAEWMAQSPANADAYNALINLDAQVFAEMAARRSNSPLQAANDDDGWPARLLHGLTGRWRVLGAGSAVAAAIALFVSVAGPHTVVIETAAGETREVAIAEGVRIHLNGSTRLEYARSDPREIKLAQGEAWFDVTHGTGKPLEVQAGKIVMRDLGTTFNVVYSPVQTELTVSAGRVVFDQGGRNITIPVGGGVRLAGGQLSVERFDVSAGDVAGWRQGRLVYRAATIERIADDVSRRSGAKVDVGPAVAGSQFTGTISLGATPEESVRKTSVMLGVSATQTGTGWRFDAAR